MNSAIETSEPGRKPSMRRRVIIAVVAVLVLFAIIAGIKIITIMGMIAQAKKNASPPQTVTVTVARYSDWQPEVTAVASVRAVHGVNITTEVTGLVRNIDFRSGDDAKAGQLLVQLNADADVATLHSLEAAADLAATVYERDKEQYAAQAISQAQLDADAADLKNKRAAAASQAATVAKKSLRAPFAGRLGITTVMPGQYLNTGDKVVSLSALDPVYVDFNLPQEQLALVHTGLTVRVMSDAFPKEHLQRQDHRHRPRHRPDQPQLHGRGDRRQPAASAAAGHVRQGRGAGRCRAALPDAAADGDHLQPVRLDRVPRRQGRER